MQLGPNAKKIANWAYHRDLKYISFVQAVHDIIIDMMRNNKQLQQDKELVINRIHGDDILRNFANL